MRVKRASFCPSDLEIVQPHSVDVALSAKIGDYVRLNSGGPQMMVVDDLGSRLVAAWRGPNDTTQEITLPKACCHFVSPLGAQSHPPV
tara:strand:- start:1683 stop:1946 length:264 start_codon:yes stop_codon:yes gene_type:complete